MHQHDAPAVPTPDQVAQANALLAAIQPPIKVVIGVTMRGLIGSFPNVRPDAVMSMICFELGQAVGTALAGDLVSILKIRKACRDAFEEGIRKSPPPAAMLATPPVPAEALKG